MGQTETLVDTIAYTPSGHSYTKVQGTATNGEFVSYTEAPSPYTYVQENGNTVTYSYMPTSNGGWSTVTYVTKKTPSGYVTYVEVPTSNGVSSYSESVETIQTAHGTATETVETLSNGSTVTYVTATGTIDGQPVTYVEEITPSGTSEFIERTYTTSSGGVATYVCGSNSEGHSVQYTELPTTSSEYVPAPVSYMSQGGGMITESYVPTASGWETIVYSTVKNSSGHWVTYVSSQTPNGATTSFVE
jgi:hypothetical protein